MSRRRTPKHLLKLISNRTLLEDTVRRLRGAVPPGNIFVLTNTAQLPEVRSALPFLSAERIIAEPSKRDTAPAAALATALVRALDPKGVVALLPADHVIRDRRLFSAQLAAALLRARSGAELITFAIKPTFASTGFGYLELGDRLAPAGSGGVFRRVRRFVEKPDAATAGRYVASGRYAWNAGMFVWRVDTFLAEAERHAPALAAFVRGFPAGDPSGYIARRFPGLPKLSVDYAIMEKTSSAATLVAGFDWDDVGTWTALNGHLDCDGSGNATRGPVVTADSANNIAVSNGRTIALCGVKDLVVVETADAVLVCHRDAVQDLKKLQPLLPKGMR